MHIAIDVDDKRQSLFRSAASDAGRPIDASRLDMRIGKIVHVDRHPDADTLYVEKGILSLSVSFFLSFNFFLSSFLSYGMKMFLCILVFLFRFMFSCCIMIDCKRYQSFA